MFGHCSVFAGFALFSSPSVPAVCSVYTVFALVALDTIALIALFAGFALQFNRLGPRTIRVLKLYRRSLPSVGGGLSVLSVVAVKTVFAVQSGRAVLSGVAFPSRLTLKVQDYLLTVKTEFAVLQFQLSRQFASYNIGIRLAKIVSAHHISLHFLEVELRMPVLY